MAKQVITPTDLGDEFDLGNIESGKVRFKTDATLVRNGSGEVGVDPSQLPDTTIITDNTGYNSTRATVTNPDTGSTSTVLTDDFGQGIAEAETMRSDFKFSGSLTQTNGFSQTELTESDEVANVSQLDQRYRLHKPLGSFNAQGSVNHLSTPFTNSSQYIDVDLRWDDNDSYSNQLHAGLGFWEKKILFHVRSSNNNAQLGFGASFELIIGRDTYSNRISTVVRPVSVCRGIQCNIIGGWHWDGTSYQFDESTFFYNNFGGLRLRFRAGYERNGNINTYVSAIDVSDLYVNNQVNTTFHDFVNFQKYPMRAEFSSGVDTHPYWIVSNQNHDSMLAFSLDVDGTKNLSTGVMHYLEEWTDDVNGDGSNIVTYYKDYRRSFPDNLVDTTIFDTMSLTGNPGVSITTNSSFELVRTIAFEKDVQYTSPTILTEYTPSANTQTLIATHR